MIYIATNSTTTYYNKLWCTLTHKFCHPSQRREQWLSFFSRYWQWESCKIFQSEFQRISNITQKLNLGLLSDEEIMFNTASLLITFLECVCMCTYMCMYVCVCICVHLHTNVCSCRDQRSPSKIIAEQLPHLAWFGLVWFGSIWFGLVGLSQSLSLWPRACWII